jgi:Protein kinase domain
MNSRGEVQSAVGEAYEVGDVVGEGGCAVVWSANDTRLGRRVAVKVLREDVATESTRVRFLREARNAASLRHPHILPVYDVGESSGVSWFTMPLVDGESLRRRIEREGALDATLVTRLLVAAAEALGAAHAQGVVHRDVKPDNVLLEGDAPHVWLVDFGIATALMPSDARLTSQSLLLGTPRYMSPEQLTPGAAVDARTDVYALGVLAYEALAGRPPFIAPNLGALLFQHLVEEPAPLSSLAPGVPSHLAQVVHRCLAKEPNDRFANGAEVAAALRGAPGSVAYRPSRPSASLLSPVPLAGASSRRAPGWLLGSVGIVLVGVAASVLLHWTAAAPLAVLAAVVIAALGWAGRHEAVARAVSPSNVTLQDRRARSLRAACALELSKLPRAWQPLLGKVDAVATTLAFEVQASVTALGSGSLAPEERRQREAQVIGAIAELEALRSAAAAAATRDPMRGRENLEHLVEARAGLPAAQIG